MALVLGISGDLVLGIFVTVVLGISVAFLVLLEIAIVLKVADTVLSVTGYWELDMVGTSVLTLGARAGVGLDWGGTAGVEDPTGDSTGGTSKGGWDLQQSQKVPVYPGRQRQRKPLTRSWH